jgi:hypothetical protein
MSRTQYPKQILPLIGDHSLLQQAALRVDGLPDFATPLIVANEEHRFIIAEQLREIAVRRRSAAGSHHRGSGSVGPGAEAELVAHGPGDRSGNVHTGYELV